MIEFSRIYDVSLPSSLSSRKKISANQDECNALAHRFKILTIDTLTATFTINYDGEEQCFKIEGHLHAIIQQESIVTLKPVLETIDVPLHIKARLVNDQEKEDSLEDDSLEDIEFIKNSKIDIGELVAQYLSLSMNPYPRNDGEEDLHGSVSDPSEMDTENNTKNPFSVLSSLKKE